MSEEIRRKSGWLLGLLLWVLCLLPGRAKAQEGSVTLQLPETAKGIELTLYAVADYDGSGYVFRDSFRGSGFSFENLNDATQAQEAAEKLAAYAMTQGVEGMAGTAGASGEMKFEKLSPALYLAAQTDGEEQLKVSPALIPVPYSSSTEAAWVYDVILSPKYTFPGGAVILLKSDEEGNVVQKARFALHRKVYVDSEADIPSDAESGSDDKGTFYWKVFKKELSTSEGGQIVVTDMPIGDYRFTETEAPDGYILMADPYYFSITEAGTVEELNDVYQPASGTVVSVSALNRQTRVIVNKVDESGAPVAGAKLTVKGSDGNVLRKEDGSASYLFTTTAEPYELKRIPVGSYFLCEVEAPDGYEVSVDEPFTVTGTADESATVTMVDKRETPTSADLTVTKTITDISDFPLMATGIFYVALFSDEACTQRVSGVKELTFDGTVSASVTFSNLEVGTVYYVSETDEAGEPLLSGAVDDKDFIPVYPDGQTVSIEPDRPHTEFAFKNMFYELPYNYYYYGKLTITKQTFRGNDPYNTDEVFYAGVFEDPDYTQRLGDVIELAMYGGSETSVTINVAIGNDSNGSKTYYVAETDEDGNVLKNSPDLEFEVSVDKTEVTLRPKTDGTVPEETVTIRNVFEEEETETETETETPSQTETTPATETETTPQTTPPGTPSTNPPGGNVRTGDDTPVAQIAVVFAVAGVAVVLLIAAGVRKRKKK